MATGPGKYDDEATTARETANARGVALIVIQGKHGSGFSVQIDAGGLVLLPEMLEKMAKEIRADLNRGATRGE